MPKSSEVRSEEENQSTEIDKEMKTTMIREIREEIKTLRKELAAVREENGELRKELATVREEMRGRKKKGQAEKADWMKRMKMREEKMEQREKNERKNNGGNEERERTGMGRKEKREGAGGDARTVRRSNTCGEMRERERRERREIWSEDSREMDEREMEEERKNRQREEWGRTLQITCRAASQCENKDAKNVDLLTIISVFFESSRKLADDTSSGNLITGKIIAYTTCLGRVDKSIISADNDVRRLQTGLLRPEIKLTGDIQVDADVTRNDKGQDSQLVLPAFWHVGANVALTVSDLFWFTVIFIDYREIKLNATVDLSEWQPPGNIYQINLERFMRASD
ncbi:hypothetical protein GEV33_005633 [Tenebrio molitor]|uniref:Uncharacterized protein n=1 Tax=Tenebrio molitor TaxID=7067 RepID=A0A8J6HP88_TENMO|nr:hypothetical protein GEV33_005633 [Tenebrio molitor]